MSSQPANKPVPKAAARQTHRRQFFRNFLGALGFAAALIGVALGLGILGYHFIAQFAWIDALLNASMILTGMGPVGTLPSDAAKIFASGYALFSAIVFITATGVLLAPIFHGVLHRFHLEKRDLND